MLRDRVNKVFFFTFCALSCFPLLSVRMTSIVIILFALFSIVSGMLDPKKINLKLIPELLVYILPFLIICVWTVAFDRSKEAYYYLERSLSLLVFPLAFFILPFRFSNRQKQIFQLLFVASTLLITIYGGIMVTIKLSSFYGPDKYWKSASEMMNDAPFSHNLRSGFEEATGFHPTYACLFLGISFLLILNRMITHFAELPRWLRAGYISALFFLVIAQVILASRTPFIGTMIASFLLFIYYQQKKIYILWAAISIVFFTGLLFLLVPSFSARLKEISLSNLTLATPKHNDSFNIRTGIYKCSVKILKENWLLGIGPGHTQKHLNECYNGISTEVYEGREYNTHNQYLDYWLGMGILAPLALLVFLVYVSYHNLVQRNALPLCLCMLFFVAMLTENILVRQGGVIAFSFIMSFYIFMGSNKEELSLTQN